MDEQGNVEVVQGIYQSFGKGDIGEFDGSRAER